MRLSRTHTISIRQYIDTMKCEYKRTHTHSRICKTKTIQPIEYAQTTGITKYFLSGRQRRQRRANAMRRMMISSTTTTTTENTVNGVWLTFARAPCRIKAKRKHPKIGIFPLVRLSCDGCVRMLSASTSVARSQHKKVKNSEKTKQIEP